MYIKLLNGEKIINLSRSASEMKEEGERKKERCAGKKKYVVPNVSEWKDMGDLMQGVRGL
jgi:hypothetical protein